MTHQLEETLLRTARKLRKWKSAKAAAEAYGWPVSTYISNENGTMPFSFEAAERYAKAFRVNATALYKNKGALVDESESVADILQVLGYVDAGKTEMYIDQTDSQFETETLPYKDGYKYIGFRVRGPSMLPRFKEGEVIIFHQHFEEYQNLLNDEVLISLKNGARLVKIFKRNPDGGFLLVSHNPAFEDIMIQESDILEVRRFKGIDR